MTPAADIASLQAVTHRYGRTNALDDVTLSIPSGCMAGLIGPDGVGKSTMLALIAGVRKIQTGTVQVLEGDMGDSRHRQRCFSRIAYMPQGLGRNLYPTLSVFENLDFIARLFGLSKQERTDRIHDLLTSIDLNQFRDRPAGKLSGGMKQKLSLCSALLHEPDLLVLDEPTTGVDPLSRRQFWELIERIRAQRKHMSVLVATAYMEEAERFDWLASMNDGRVIATGTPAQIKAQAATDDLESAFVAMLPQDVRQSHKGVRIPPRVPQHGPPAIEAEGLTKRFGNFVAVDRASFRIEKGEIFGFLGSNGCGKSTTMKMLTGLLPSSEGTATLLGKPISDKGVESRSRVGYMSQSFSLYTELTVRQNLVLHTRLFEIPDAEKQARVEEMLDRFGLREVAAERPDALPLGMRQRLQLAVAVQHKPEMLILDEPTSGVDPIARDEFWQYLVDLSRNDGVTIFLSTHFMNEAERCDRISLMHAGKVLAVDTPQALTQARNAPTLEDAFVSYLEDARNPSQNQNAQSQPDPNHRRTVRSSASAPNRVFALGRLWAYARRESVEILRDRMRLAFAILGPIILLLTFGYGISFDVESLPYAVFDQDQTPESRQLLQTFEGSQYFERREDIQSPDQIDDRLKSGELMLAIEIPPRFGKDLVSGRTPEVGVWIDGAMPFRAETTSGYISGVAVKYLSNRQAESTSATAASQSVDIQSRFRYNQSFRSIYAIVPGVIMLVLILIPAVMTAVGVVHEKESGSIANFRSSPVTSFEYLVGKQVPYIAIGLISFITLGLISWLVFSVPVNGSLLAMCVGVLFYVMAATGFGLVVSTFTRTQVAAVFATAIISIIPAVNFSGLLVPVSSLSTAARTFGLAFPAAWFQQISLGTYTKSLGFAELWPKHLALAIFATLFIGTASLVLRKQED
ncbi:MAG: ribosome-associated ATPase/putative transporter RbbA [Phycisphaerales bacterium JB047]